MEYSGPPSALLPYTASVEPITGQSPAGHRLTPLQLDELAKFPSPTIANAIETFQVRGRLEGVTDGRIRCLFPALGPVVGYACTAAIVSAEPASQPRRVSRRAYWEYLHAFGVPRISVVQDLSPTPGGAYWGEINSTMHRALGSQGVITNGAVRDLDEVERLGFHFFASGVQVSHGYAHLEDFNCPVELFGMEVKPGDLIHADKHGAVIIPHGVAERVADAARQIERNEKPMLDACRLPNPIDQLDRLISPEY